MSDLISIDRTDDGTLVVSSEQIAEGAGVQHKNVLELLATYRADFEAFGGVAFKTRPFETAGGVQHKRVALLNEPQASLLMTYQRNTEQVRRFKGALVKAFYNAHQQPLSEIEVAKRWLSALEGKKAAEEKVRELAPKAEYVDQFVSPGENLTFRQLASNLDVQEKKLREILLDRGWIYMEEAERWSRKKQAIEVVRRYSANADKRHYFHALPQHKAPLFKNQVMHTLYVTPPGAVAINRLVKHLREGKALLEVVVAG